MTIITWCGTLCDVIGLEFTRELNGVPSTELSTLYMLSYWFMLQYYWPTWYVVVTTSQDD